jgi:hypothetical protein
MSKLLSKVPASNTSRHRRPRSQFIMVAYVIGAAPLMRGVRCLTKNQTMKYERDIKNLGDYTFLGQAASLLVFLFGVFSIILFFNPGLIGIPRQQHQYYRGQWVWLLTGIGFLIFAIFCSIFAGRRRRRPIWILNNVQPELMRLTVEIEHWSDSTDYYGILSGAEEKYIWRVSLYNPSWKVEALAGEQLPVKVYIDPQRKEPAVIETEHGLLWARSASNNSSNQSTR